MLPLKVVHLPIVCQSERSLHYFHLGLAIILYSSLEFPNATNSREKIQGSLVVENSFSGISLKYGRLKKYRFLSKIKLRPPIETVWSLNFRASTPTLYVKNKMAEASLLPQKEGKKFFLGHSRVFLLDF